VTPDLGPNEKGQEVAKGEVKRKNLPMGTYNLKPWKSFPRGGKRGVQEASYIPGARNDKIQQPGGLPEGGGNTYPRKNRQH